MEEQRAYLDCNATAPLRPEARRAAFAALALAGNPSAVHGEGRQARRLIEDARRELAYLVGATAANVVFTSGGSEGAATLLSPHFTGRSGRLPKRLIVSAIEHSCVLAGGRFASEAVDICPVLPDGIIDLTALEQLLVACDGEALIAVMLANNETGIIQPISDVVALARRFGAAIICDAVQAVGKIAIDMTTFGVDALFLSGHKLGAPQGVGAIVLADGVDAPPSLIRGGAQENRHRAGTENLAGIAGLGAACRVIMQRGASEVERITALRDDMERRLAALSPAITIIGQAQPRLGNTSLVLARGLNAETAVIALDLAGVAVATGSACASGKVSPSHVLKAMGLAPAEARSALRVSLGWSTSAADINRFVAAFAAHLNRVAGRPRAA